MSVGQLRMLLDRERLTEQRIERLEPAERRGLDTLRRAQAFGHTIGLVESDSYRHAIERDRDSAVRVVTAAEPDRLEPVTWWFPVVGRISYRGYFDPDRAHAFAEGLANQGLDTYVRPALLYSTLGYFADPIPLSVLRWPDVDLVDVAIHEQVHETIFVAGDPDYNEALASFIARHATLAFFGSDPERLDRARGVFADRDRFGALLDELYHELAALYAETTGPDDARARRAEVFARYQGPRFAEIEWSSDRYRGFASADLNNSYLLARRTYRADGPCFEVELDALGGDLPAFVAAHVEDPGHRACPGAAE